MGKHSSTSSSDGPALPSGFPWALGLALIAVACVEIVFRTAEPRALIPYSLGRQEYQATAQLLEAYGPAEVSFIGSSRTREGIDMPMLSDRLASALGRPVTVANYACAAARASENLKIVEYLLANGRPKFVLYGVSCWQLWGDSIYRRNVLPFSTVSDWRLQLRENPSKAGSILPRIIWGEIGARWLTLKYRKRARTLAMDVVRAFWHRDMFPFDVAEIFRGAPSPSPQRGESTRWHRVTPNKSLQTRLITEERVTAYMARLLRGGDYFFTNMQEESIRKILHKFRAAGTNVVLFEIPLPTLLEEHEPAGTLSRARATLARIAAGEKVPFISVEDYDIDWADADFLEQSHMNFHGAARLTKWLADHVLIPHLLRESKRGRS